MRTPSSGDGKTLDTSPCSGRSPHRQGAGHQARVVRELFGPPSRDLRVVGDPDVVEGVDILQELVQYRPEVRSTADEWMVAIVEQQGPLLRLGSIGVEGLLQVLDPRLHRLDVPREE